MPLVWVSVAWLAGTWAGSAVQVPWEGAAIVSMAALLLGLQWWDRSRLPLLAAVCLGSFLFGGVRYEASLPSANGSSLGPFYGRIVELQGVVAADPQVLDKSSHLRVDVSAIMPSGEWVPAMGTVLVVAQRFPIHSYGESVRLTGKLEAPQPFDDFDYPGYLARQGIYSIMTLPEIQVLNEGGGNTAWSWLLKFKRALADNLSRVLPEPQASLAQGMLLGIRSAIPQELMDSFSLSGITHIIVISGQNLTLLAGYVLRGGQVLVGRRRALWLSLASIVLYTLLVGAQPPVVRAVIMSSIFILGTYLGRQSQATIGLSLAAALMVAFQPSMLWDVSFQLSFAATAGLMFVAPLLQHGIDRLWASPGTRTGGPAERTRLYIVENLAVTLGATAAVLPLLLVNFQRLSIVAPVANLLVLPALPGIMLTSGLACIIGFLPLAGQVAGWVAWPFLTYLTSLAGFLGNLPLASLDVPGFEAGLAVAYYALLCLALLWKPSRATAVR